MKKPLLIVITLILFTASIYSQIVSVVDHDTGQPLKMATIISQVPKAFAVTNNLGKADVSAFKNAGEIEVRSLGYRPEILSYNDIESSLFIVMLTPVHINVDEVVISATRWRQVTGDIPAKISTISPAQLALQNSQTAADMLAISGRVFIQKSQQGGGSPMIRGFATNRLLYTIDGVRMNTAIFRSGNLQNVISLDPLAIESTEIVFGPGSVIYGSDAIGGVMSFQTLTPQLSTGDKPLISGSALSRYSTANNEKSAHFDIGVGWKKWAMISSISSSDYGDLKMGSHGPEEYLRPFYVERHDSADVIIANSDPRIQRPSGYSQLNMMQKIRYSPSERLDIVYGFHYSETSDYARYDRHIRYKNGLPRYGEWSYGPQKWMMNMLSVSYTANNRVYDQVSLRLAHQLFGESRISRNINDPARETRTEKVNAYSANLDFLKSTGSRNRIIYGFEAVSDNVISTGEDYNIDTHISSAGPSRYPQSDWSSYAVYISDHLKVTDKFIVQAGVRYNQYLINATFDNTFYPFPFSKTSISRGALTGSAGFVLRPSDEWTINTNIATAFRSPNIDDIGKVFDSEPGSVVVPNPGLEAEYAYNIDLGVSRIIGDMIKIDISAYYTLLNNAMVRRDFTLNGLDSIIYDGEMSKVQAIQNAAKATVYGIQAGVEVKLASGFGLNSDFNYQKGEEELDDGSTSPTRHAPPAYGITRLTYEGKDLYMQFYTVYSGKKSFADMPEEEKGKTEIYATDSNGDPWSPGWYTLNFKASYQVTEHFELSAGLENITDQRYRPYSSGICAPGRNFILSARVQF